MRTTTKAGIKATYYDANVWKQERLLISIEKTAGSTATKVSLYYPTHSLGSFSSPFVIYDLDNNGKAVIDVTDLIRTYAATNSTEYIYIYSDLAASSSAAIDISTKVIGLINPERTLIPYQKLLDSQLLISPPMKMLMRSTLSSSPLVFEFYRPYNQIWTLLQYENNVLKTTTSLTSNGSITLTSSSIDKIILLRSGISQTYNLTPTQCGREYAMVEWVSFTGATRRHIFEVRKAQTASANNYSLLTDDNSYHDIKGREDSFVLYLDGLNQYDYWYYADLITSSKVRMYIVGQIGNDSGEWNQVQVATKSVTQPDGNAFDGKLEIQVNWKRYDAVAM